MNKCRDIRVHWVALWVYWRDASITYFKAKDLRGGALFFINSVCDLDKTTRVLKFSATSPNRLHLPT